MITAHIRHKLEILVDTDQPVAEINNVISAFLRLHPARELEILSAVKREIDGALAAMTKGDGNHESSDN